MKIIANETIDELIYEETLDNGLNILTMPKKGFNHQYAIFATNYGSIDNNFVHPDTGEEVRVPDGIAHFLEHKLFEGDEENTFSRFADLGSATNAYTNFTTTAYLFSSTTNFRDSLLNLINFVQTPYFTDENVEKEKGIIAQEIKMYEDDPHYQLFFNLLQGLYHHHPVKIDIAGTVDSIKEITKEDLFLCYNTFYHPSNMVLFLTGDIEVNETINYIKENQKHKNFSKPNKIKRIFPDEPPTVNKKVIKINMDVPRPLFELGFKEKYINIVSRELIKQELASNMILDLMVGRGTKLFQSLYEDGLIDDNFSYGYTRQRNFGYLSMGGETKDPDLLFDRLVKGIYNAKKNLNENEFKRVYKIYLGEFLDSFNSLELIAAQFINYYFKGVNYLKVMDILNEIDLDYLLSRYDELFSDEQYTRSIIIQ